MDNHPHLRMCGVRYASAAAVKPRGTILTIGITTELRETCKAIDAI